MASPLRETEAAIAALRVELVRTEQPAPGVPPIQPAWVGRRMEHLEVLLAGDPFRTRLKIARHLDGDLTVEPRTGEDGQRSATPS